MCQLDNTQIEAVQDVVTEMVKDSKMFTAWDVTVRLRNQPNLGNIRHRDGVRECIHSMFNDDADEFYGYERTSVFVPKASSTVLVFHPLGTDAEQYNDDTVVSDEDVDEDDVDDSTDSTDSTDVGTKVDKRGRLCIRKATLQEAGITAGSTVIALLSYHPNIISKTILKVRVADGTTTQDTYLVDPRDNNVRISRRLLKKISTSNNFNIEVIGCGNLFQ